MKASPRNPSLGEKRWRPMGQIRHSPFTPGIGSSQPWRLAANSTEDTSWLRFPLFFFKQNNKEDGGGGVQILISAVNNLISFIPVIVNLRVTAALESNDPLTEVT